jgi:hypothetical protein
MNLFKDADRRLIEAQDFDETGEPAFELLKACLIWPDECPAGISNAGREVLNDLFIVRGFIHRGLPKIHWGLDPLYFSTLWENALASGIVWNGFRRIELLEKDYLYLVRSLSEPISSD